MILMIQECLIKYVDLRGERPLNISFSLMTLVHHESHIILCSYVPNLTVVTFDVRADHILNLTSNLIVIL